ncbi:MAG: hypothetical protein MJ241_02690 [Bacilli bacterium]|nr:hypothetical protein [Bacilli bacterium]
MKKIFGHVLGFAILFSLAACWNNVGFDNCSNSELFLPGGDRLWWDSSFDDVDEVKNFIVELKNAQKNGDFNFGVCDFKAPVGYEIFGITFSGHIDSNASKEEDIYNSSYDYFEIKLSFYKDLTTLPANNRFDIYFYPFCLKDSSFANDKIEHNVLDYYDGSCDISFTYDEIVFMETKLLAECNSQINKENMIGELTNNYVLIV